MGDFNYYIYYCKEFTNVINFENMLHYLLACTKFHHVALCSNLSWVQDNSAPKYKKKSSGAAKAHVHILAGTPTAIKQLLLTKMDRSLWT